LPLLNDDDGFLVSDVIKTLVIWRSPEVLPPLCERARDNRFFVRKEAIKALGKFKDARAVDAIIPHLKEDGFEAEAALKEIGPMAEPALIQRLRDPEPAVRRRACEILQQIGGMDTLQAMQAVPADQDLGVRMAAKRASEQIVARVGPPPRAGSAKASVGTESKRPSL
jgi:HEAT repeat protein